MARSAISLRCQSSDAVGGEADMPRPLAPYQSDATDPTRTSIAEIGRTGL